MSLWMTILLQMYFWRSCCHKDTNTNVDVLCRHRLLATMPYLYKYAAWIDDIFTCVCTSVVLPCDSASTVCDLSLSVLSARVLYCVSVLYCTVLYCTATVCVCCCTHSIKQIRKIEIHNTNKRRQSPQRDVPLTPNAPHTPLCPIKQPDCCDSWETAACN